jgi:hypothetical protein
MDPGTLIVTALGATAAREAASDAVRDAYRRLRAQTKRRLAGRAAAEYVLDKHEEAPETWQAPLTAELVRAGADGDPELLSAARTLLDLVDEPGARAGKYSITIRSSQGIQVGDHNIQVNTFGSPPGEEGTGQ